jgi:hypothetical protein
MLICELNFKSKSEKITVKISLIYLTSIFQLILILKRKIKYKFNDK